MVYYSLLFGSITNIFDYLTSPIITYGMGIIIYLLLDMNKNNRSLKEKIMEVLKLGFLWLAGYGLTWISKWILTDVIYGKHIISSAIGEIFFRLGNTINYGYDETFKITPLLSLFRNIIQIIIPFATLININIIISIVSYKKIDKEKLYNLLPFAIISILPVMKYIIVVNQSYQHAIFTYRELFLTILSMLLYGYFVIDKKSLKEKKRSDES